MRVHLPVVLFCTIVLVAPLHAATTFTVAAADLADPLILIAYGDMRFTQTGETGAS
jgi:hypothetical protein